MFNSALEYFQQGFSIIPIRADGSKKPLVEWVAFQNTRPDEKQIKSWWEKWPEANIGIITGKINGITVFDIDWYKMNQTESTEIASYLPKVFTPTAFSPRGGEHRYFEYNVKLPTRNEVLKNVDIKNDGGYIIAPPSKNGSGNYTWYERASLVFAKLHVVPHSYISNINTYSLSRGGNASEIKKPQIGVSSRIRFDEGSRDQTLFHIANHLIKGNMPQDEIQYLLTLMAKNLCKPPFPQKEIPAKIKSAIKRSEQKNINISEAVRDWVLSTRDHMMSTGCLFKSTDVYKNLDLSTSVHRKSMNMALSRLVKDGIIAKHGDTIGLYRIISETDAEDINDIEEGKLIDVRLPFGLEKYLDVMPKDLIVYAGVPNSGKTAFLLETIRLNMKKQQCWYFSSEMGKQACKRRLKKYDGDLRWNFKIQDSFNNYIDIIRPNDLNFIDYLEVSEGEYYKIASMLGEIQRKLKNGLAFVAIQKNPGADYAVGGPQTTGKPALFISIEANYPHNILKVVKAKNFKDENPNGYVMKFKIVGGINLIPAGVWGPDYD